MIIYQKGNQSISSIFSLIDKIYVSMVVCESVFSFSFLYNTLRQRRTNGKRLFCFFLLSTTTAKQFYFYRLVSFFCFSLRDFVLFDLRRILIKPLFNRFLFSIISEINRQESSDEQQKKENTNKGKTINKKSFVFLYCF
jgi:hypothetical protein